MSYPSFDMTLNEYQKRAIKTAFYPGKGEDLRYPSLKLAGEAGEVAEKVGKLWRDRGVYSGDNLTDEERSLFIKELGDVLWYLAALSTELGVSLGHVADTNIEKLASRKARGVLGGSGDTR